MKIVYIFFILVSISDIFALNWKKVFKFKNKNGKEVPVEIDENAKDFETQLIETDFVRARKIVRNGDIEMLYKKPEDVAKMMQKARKFEGDIHNIDKSNFGSFIKSVKNFFKNLLKGKFSVTDDEDNRNALRNNYGLWPSGRVPYSISNKYSAYARSVLAAAIDEYTQKTCIKFVPKTNADKHYLYIFSGQGCYSSVGQSGGKQELSLGNGCIDKGVVQHELMHAVGFFHEQSRADRDVYVKVLTENIEDGMENNFEKYDLNLITHLNTSYDYGSLMHYGRNYFSKNGKDTLVPVKDPKAQIGQRIALSGNDLLKLNRLYNCPNRSDGSEEESAKKCTDAESTDHCRYWKSLNYCQTDNKFSSFMQIKCSLTCGVC